jgi:hypothetical protein
MNHTIIKSIYEPYYIKKYIINYPLYTSDINKRIFVKNDKK